MLDSDCVQRFEAVDDAQCFSIFLEDAEPVQTIGRVGGFIDSGFHLLANELAYVLVDPRWNWKILLDPGDVRDYGELYQWKEIRAKASALKIIPCEALIL